MTKISTCPNESLVGRAEQRTCYYHTEREKVEQVGKYAEGSEVTQI